jgi:hypothetical protein
MARQQAKSPPAEEQETQSAPAEAEETEKTPEQALEDQLELARFVDRLRRKFH